ncbi:MAG: hypothetical protein ACRDWI_08500 [Jiangellaceae bacterium]
MQEAIVIATALDRPDTAALLTGAFEGLCERHGARPPAALQRFLDRHDPFAAARDALDAEELQAAVARGRRVSLDEAMALIVELGNSVEDATTGP